LRRQIQDEADARRLAMAIAEQAEIVDVLMDGLAEMHMRLDALRSRRTEMATRVEITGERVGPGATVRVDLLDPASEIARFEEKIRREEARILGRDVVTISAIDTQFEGLEFAPADLEIEARLAAMKSDQIS
jgi:phage shock protein A